MSSDTLRNVIWLTMREFQIHVTSVVAALSTKLQKYWKSTEKQDAQLVTSAVSLTETDVSDRATC